MELQKIRELRNAYPFKPFKLVMEDGRKLLVDHPYYLGVQPGDQFLVWSDMEGGFKRISLDRVKDAVLVRQRRRSTGKRRPGSA